MAPRESGGLGRDREADTRRHPARRARSRRAHGRRAAPRRAEMTRIPGRRAPASPGIPAAETEPPQVSALPVAQIQWHRTLAGRADFACRRLLSRLLASNIEARALPLDVGSKDDGLTVRLVSRQPPVNHPADN